MHLQNWSIGLALAVALGCGVKEEELPPADLPFTNHDTGVSADDTAAPGPDADTDSDVDADADADADSDTDADSDDTGGPVGTDNDGDGVTVEAGDCDDSDSSRYPGNSESCNGIDNDCDGEVDSPNPVDGALWYPDFDGDSWGQHEANGSHAERL